MKGVSMSTTPDKHQSGTNSQAHAVMVRLVEEVALLRRLKELRRLGQQAEADKLAATLDLLDLADDYSLRYGL